MYSVNVTFRPRKIHLGWGFGVSGTAAATVTVVVALAEPVPGPVAVLLRTELHTTIRMVMIVASAVMWANTGGSKPPE